MTAAPALGSDPYADPSVYDILHAPGSAAELDALQRAATPHLRRRRPLWLEPACGSGRLLALLARRGHRVRGFDRSAPMVAYARERLRRRGLPPATVFRADLTDFAGGLRPASADVAILPLNSIRHLESDAALRLHLREMARVLRPGGIYLVGISLSTYGTEPIDEDVWEGRRGRCRVSQVVQYLPPPEGERFERVLSHLRVERPRGVEHFDHAYALRCYDEPQWERVLRRSPLRRLPPLHRNGREAAPSGAPYQLERLLKP